MFKVALIGPGAWQGVGRDVQHRAGQPRCANVSIGDVVDRLCASPSVSARRAAGVGFEPPSRPVLIDVLDQQSLYAGVAPASRVVR